MPLSHFFTQSLNAVYDQLSTLSYADFVTMKTTNNFEPLQPLIDTINQLQAEVIEQGLNIKALKQAQFHATNLLTMTHLETLRQWQYAEATLAELRLVKRLIESAAYPDANESSDESQLTNLPPELIDTITSFLPQQSLINLKKTNHFFNTFVSINRHLKLTLKAIIPASPNTFFLLSDGQAFVKGQSEYSEYSHFTKVRLSNDLPIKNIITSYNQIFFVDSDNGIHVAGTNIGGVLGVTKEWVTKPHQPVRFSGNDEHAIKTIINNSFRTFIQDETGLWFGYGDNSYNRLGINTSYQSTTVGIRLFSDDIDKIVPGLFHTFFLVKNQWYASGCSDHGQLGSHPDTLPRQSPFPITLPNKEAIVDVAAGNYFSFFKGESGQWYACGDNQYGSLSIKKVGHHNQITTPTPIHLPNDKKLVTIVCRSLSTCMQDEDGNWYGCGNNLLNRLALAESCRFVDVPTPLCFTTSEHAIKTVNFGYHNTHYFLDSNDQWWQFGGEAKTPRKFNIDRLLFDVEQAPQSSSSSSSSRP